MFAAGAAPTIMLFAGCLLLIYTLMRKAHLEEQADRRSRVISDVHPLPPPQAPWNKSASGIDTAERAKDLNGQLSNKVVVLERLIADSQKQIERMEELLGRMEAAKRD